MKQLVLAATVAFTSTTFAQDDAASGPTPAEQAKAVLENVHKAYTAAGCVSEEMVVHVPEFMGMEEQLIKVDSKLGATNAQFLVEDQMSLYWVDGKLAIITPEDDASYLQVESESLLAGLEELMPGGAGMMPGMWAVELRYNDSFENWMNSFMMGAPGGTVESVDKTENGSVINLKSMMGTVAVNVDDNKIGAVVMEVNQPGAKLTISVRSKVEFLKDAPVIKIDAGDRKKYESMDEYMEANGFAEGVEMPEEEKLSGGVAPDFTLANMDGSGNVTLSELKGSVVVLDFWATWCGPCKRGLPYLNQFNDWVKAEGLNVKVYAVNVWEEGQDEKIKKFWTENEYTVDVLMGSDDKKLTDNYKVNGIPTTVIVGLDGSISNQHSGFSGGDKMIADLKEAVTKALGGGDSDEGHAEGHDGKEAHDHDG